VLGALRPGEGQREATKDRKRGWDGDKAERVFRLRWDIDLGLVLNQVSWLECKCPTQAHVLGARVPADGLLGSDWIRRALIS
jgi:hypothetical protein